MQGKPSDERALNWIDMNDLSIKSIQHELRRFLQRHRKSQAVIRTSALVLAQAYKSKLE
jgi:hypothetical protein